MATPEEELRRRLSATVVRPSTEIPQAFREAGGGVRGIGAATGEVIRQGTMRPIVETGTALVRPVGEFLQGLILGAPSAPTAPARTSAQAPRLPSLVNVTAATPPTPAQPPARPPLRPGQTARPSVTQPQRATASTFGIDNVPQGGGFISFDEPLRASTLQQMAPRLREQLEQTGAIRVTPEQGRSLASQATVVPSSFFTGGTGQPAAVSPAPQTVGPQRSQLISDRSQDFDALLRDLVSQATREPGSYGELFRRRGVLDALSQVAGVAQGAGTNLTQDITNLRDVLERRRSADLTAEAQAAQRGVTTRGQNLLFESGVLGDLLRSMTEQERTGVLREGQQAQLTGIREQIKSTERLAKDRPAQELAGNPIAQLGQLYLTEPNAERKAQILAMVEAWVRAQNATPLLVP